ncbi:MAG: hypothetical protein MUF49_22990 [Oculatellaceae cyanobacterium Prado106]|jgi:peptide subunit release factor 1 (eRF1)|nr:hypothetical protein [Oculatellaceae cyanobacterium Prado106]
MNQRPWMIIATFPGHPPKAIARTSYKADADAHIRFLQRYMNQGDFSVVLESDLPESMLATLQGEPTATAVIH